ncbi:MULTISPECIES: hypothetical protein [Streptomyces]|uniref:DUF3558 domain-containing protein n=1 Tax=Streptomyces fuscus TaxID=3048495 RepID=A0ABT7J980_9ACTN|nr:MULTISPECIES: hypothetical protein [Streptomyces]MCM1976916.1 DUF3558 domain-containing protein [Streptomyces sp. G1]MDL2081445.1 DUF3558 domain-containing protein [Streptomyces fuscus]SBT88505.1 hypothetical protein GA0115233_100327 [Streptomyces sp. DI166]
MQRKAYVSGVAALLAALLAGCTGSSDDGGPTDGSNPGDSGTATAAAEPGRYRTLPEPCGSVEPDTLDALLPGIPEVSDEEQREKLYEGTATLTYDTDRKVGCRWKVDSAAATDHLFIDFERVVSYDTAVSDDSQAEDVFARLRTEADLPEPADTDAESSGSESPDKPTDAVSNSLTPSDPDASPSSSATSAPDTTPADLQPRLLEDLGDEAFLNDVLSSAGSTAKQRTVTVAFRTSNVVVTIQYEEQPATVGVVPDSKEMQDRALNLAIELAETLAG